MGIKEPWKEGRAKVNRVTIEVAGYRWLVHGAKSNGKWEAHLVELLGGERLDAPLNDGLMSRIRTEVAHRLGLNCAVVAPIGTGLVLAW